MTETALQLRHDDNSGRQAGVIFLCHNSKDKEAVKQIADALDLEFGTRFFLDAYAIPVGEEFLAWIERSLGEAQGCAIFLGANGWGSTHFLEAEKALARYKADSRFKLIPVALPGIAPEDMQRLGAGKVFQEINWADFRKGLDDQDSLDKLAAALTGKELPQDRGPARLTPYQIRRDALRWRDAKKERESILYRGAQLTEAERLVRENPDFVVVDEVIAFLTASQSRQRSYWRRVAVGGILGSAIFLGLSVAAYVGYTLAEQRRGLSLSRQLAIISREASSPDLSLLIAARALLIANTPEARGNLLDRLQSLRYLRRLIHLNSSLESVGVDLAGGRILLGTNHGELGILGADSSRPTDTIALGRQAGAVCAISAADGGTWLGREDGSLEFQPSAGSAQVVLPAPAASPGKDFRILALERQSPGRILAIGTASGRLLLVGAEKKTALSRWDEGPGVRITSLAFDSSGRWLAAGTSAQTILFVDLASRTIKQRYPGLEGGASALGFGKGGELSAITGYGQLITFVEKRGEFQRVRSTALRGLISSAVVDGPRNRLALGDASGQISVYDLSGDPVSFASLPGHGAPVSAVAFGPGPRTLVSVSTNGTAAIWDLSGSRGPSSSLPSFAPEPSIVRVTPEGDIVAGASTTGTAGVWRLVRGSNAWSRVADLIADSRATAGQESLEPPDHEHLDPGFVSIGDSEITALAMDRDAKTIAWVTIRGAVLRRALDVEPAQPTLILPSSREPRGDIALSDSGTVLAVIDMDGRAATVVKTGRDPRTIALAGTARSIAVSANGGTLAVGLDDGRIALLESDTGAPIGRPTQVHDSPVSGLVFADDQRIISFGAGGGGSDRTIAVVPSPSLSPIVRLQARQAGGSVSSLSSGRQSDLLAAGDQDGQVLLWSYSDLRFMAPLTVGGTNVASIALDDARSRLISVNSDGTFLTFNLDPVQWIRLACEKANRPFREDEWKEILPDDPYQPTCNAQDAPL